MNNWTWDRLRVFDAVARAGSVAAAARSLRMTGSAVSQHLRRLEVEVGSALVERAGRGLRLTDAGQVLAGHAREVTRTVEHAERDLAGLDDELHGTVRVGAISSVIKEDLLQRVREFTDRCPRVRVSLCDSETVDHLQALHEDRLDVVAAEHWHDLPSPMARGANVTRLFTERARLVLPHDHRAANVETVPLAELAGEVWTCCPPGSDAHAVLTHLMRRAGADLHVGSPPRTTRRSWTWSRTGSRWRASPTSPLERELPGIRIADADPAPRRSIELVTRADPLPPHINEFVAALARR